jgi:hypothetical protein
MYGGNAYPPIPGELVPGFCRLLVEERRFWDPEKAVQVAGSTGLPLESVPVVYKTEKGA